MNKAILITIIINIFLLVAFTVMFEYASLGDSMTNLQTTFDTAVDTAVDLSMMSEEFFSSDMNDEMLSVARSNYEEDKLLQSSTRYLRNGNWVQGNTYVITMYRDETGMFPETQEIYDAYLSTLSSTTGTHRNTVTKSIFKHFFGGVGSDYLNSSLSWANGTYATTEFDGIDSSSVSLDAREPVAEFKNFYDNIGKLITSKQIVKEKTATSWDIAEINAPVLSQMGLSFEGNNGLNGITANNYTDELGVLHTVTSDNYTSVTHLGRLVNGTTDRSEYFLTPFSLGVTYIPKNLLDTTIRLNLENFIRCTRSRADLTNIDTLSDLDDLTSSIMQAYSNAEGCIEDAFLDYSGDSNSYNHKLVSTEEIYNDGKIEYDLNSLTTEITYYLVDFYDDNNWRIVNKVLGSTPYADKEDLPSKLKYEDTTIDGDKDGNRIVAKVTASIDIHIPYTSAILQWYIRRTSTQTSEHYGIRGTDSSGLTILDSDTLRYEYTVYTTISR